MKKFFGEIFGSLFGDSGIVTKFFNWIGDMGEMAWGWIKGLFSSGAKSEIKNEINNALNSGESKAPDVITAAPAVAAEPAKAPAAENKYKEELSGIVSRVNSDEFKNVVYRAQYAPAAARDGIILSNQHPADPVYGTAAKPATALADDGRMIIYVPTGARVALSPWEGDPSKVIVTLIPEVDKQGRSDRLSAFGGMSLPPISRGAFEHANIAFQQVEVDGTPARINGKISKHGEIHIGAAEGLLPRGTRLVMQHIISPVKAVNADVLINGDHLHKGRISDSPVYTIGDGKYDEAKALAVVRNNRYAEELEHDRAWHREHKPKNETLAQARREQGVTPPSSPAAMTRWTPDVDPFTDAQGHINLIPSQHTAIHISRNHRHH